jgi:hypothetical protein
MLDEKAEADTDALSGIRINPENRRVKSNRKEKDSYDEK